MTVGVAAAFFGGVLTLLSPCSAMLLPGFFAYAFASRRRLLGRTGLFYLGLVTTLVPLGVAAASVGVFFNANRALVTSVGGGLLILFGLLYLAGIPLPLPRMHREAGTSALGVYLLGATYGVAGGCTGPILGSILTLAAMAGAPLYGGALLAVYAAGMALPVALLAVLWDRLRLGQRRLLRARALHIGGWSVTSGQAAAGLLFMAIGLLLIVTDGTSDLGGLLTAQQDIGVESWLSSVGGPVLDAAVLGVLSLLVALATVPALLRWRGTTGARAPKHAPMASSGVESGERHGETADADPDR